MTGEVRLKAPFQGRIMRPKPIALHGAHTRQTTHPDEAGLRKISGGLLRFRAEPGVSKGVPFPPAALDGAVF